MVDINSRWFRNTLLSNPRKQFDKNFALFEILIVENVMNYGKERYKPTTISDEMRQTYIVNELMSKLNIHENIGRNMYPGEIMMETRKEHGFSLRVYSRKSTTNHSLSVMAQSGGRPEIIFPSKMKMEKYLDYRKQNAILRYSRLLYDLGFDNNLPERNQCRVPIKIVEENIEKFIDIIKELASM